jgi:hypothetical protein
MVDLVENPSLIVVDSVVLNCLVGVFLSESVDYLNLVESNHYSSLGSTRNVVNLICLYSDLNGLV